MNIKTVFEVGNKTTIQLIRRANSLLVSDNESPVYPSQIMYIDSQYDLRITVPSDKYMKPVLMGIGDLYIIRFYTKLGFYQCHCVVQSIGKENNVIFASIRLASDMEKYQRREYFRLEYMADIEFFKPTKDQEKMYEELKNCSDAKRKLLLEQIKEEDIVMNKGIIQDISGGGIRFSSPYRFEEGDPLIMFPDIRQLKDTIPYLFGHIVLTKESNSDSLIIESKLKFYNLSKEEREKIITFVFAAEREKIKNQ